MSFTTRVPVPSDAAAIAELHISTWREAYAHLLSEDYFSEEYIEGRQRMWKHVLEHPRDDVTVRVAESDGSIIGFAWVGPGVGVDDEEPAMGREGESAGHGVLSAQRLPLRRCRAGRPARPNDHRRADGALTVWESGDRFDIVMAAELELLDDAVRRDPDRVGYLLHLDFAEIGRSGRRWTRDESMASLEVEQGRVTPETDEWLFNEVAPTLVLVTYWITTPAGSSRHA